MLRRAGWAIGMVLLVTRLAAAQTTAQPEPERLPTAPKVLPDKDALKAKTDASGLGEYFPVTETRPTSGSYVGASYLLWWYHREPSPPLVTTAPDNGKTPKGLVGGILGEQGTTPVFTSDNLDYGSTSGMRVAAGIDLCSDRFWSLEAIGFFLPRRSLNLRAVGNPDGTPLITMPFLDASTGKQQALDISSQDFFGAPFLTGSVTIHSDIQLWGYELNLVAHSIRATDRSVELFAGFRALGMDENMSIAQRIVALQDGAISLQFPTAGLGQPATGTQGYYSVPTGGIVNVFDSFSTRNRFYGAQLGGRFIWDLGRLSVDLTAKAAIGVTEQSATIFGVSTATSGSLGGNPPVANLVTPGGMFALQNNTGAFSRSQFTIAPEIGLNFGYAVTPWMNLRFGYSALYWSNVVRPGGQIDPVLNSKLIPTGAFQPFITPGGTLGAFAPGQEQGRPYFSFHDTPFWAHGVQFGVELRY